MSLTVGSIGGWVFPLCFGKHVLLPSGPSLKQKKPLVSLKYNILSSKKCSIFRKVSTLYISSTGLLISLSPSTTCTCSLENLEIQGLICLSYTESVMILASDWSVPFAVQRSCAKKNKRFTFHSLCKSHYPMFSFAFSHKGELDLKLRARM